MLTFRINSQIPMISVREISSKFIEYCTGYTKYDQYEEKHENLRVCKFVYC